MAVKSMLAESAVRRNYNKVLGLHVHFIKAHAQHFINKWNYKKWPTLIVSHAYKTNQFYGDILTTLQTAVPVHLVLLNTLLVQVN